MKVITADAYTLREIDGAHVNIDNWKITNLDIKLTREASKELGLKKIKIDVVNSLFACKCDKTYW